MKIFLFICGFLLLIYSFIFLLINVTIVSAPPLIMIWRDATWLFIILMIPLGLYFLYTGKKYQSLLNSIFLNKIFYKILIKNNFKITIFEFAKEAKISLNDAYFYIDKKSEKSEFLNFQDAGLIHFDYKSEYENLNNKNINVKNKSKNRRRNK